MCILHIRLLAVEFFVVVYSHSFFVVVLFAYFYHLIQIFSFAREFRLTRPIISHLPRVSFLPYLG